MRRKNSIKRQPANLWWKRLLGGLWAAADVFDLRIQPEATPRQLVGQTMKAASIEWAGNLIDAMPRLLNMDSENDILNNLRNELGSRGDGGAEDGTPRSIEATPAPQENIRNFEQWQQFRREYLLQLGYSLVLFSINHFAFLHEGFYGFSDQPRIEFDDFAIGNDFKNESQAIQDLIKNLQPKAGSIEGLIDFAFRTTLNQIAFDLLALNRAWVYHSPTHNATVAERIMRADSLARQAVESMQSYLPGATAALTYVERVANVRVVPYAPVALIGIPISALAVDRDLLAIAHEFSHFLYWNGQPNQSKSPSFNEWCKAGFSEKPEKLSVSHWMEEIFADVVGCLIGGPAVALSFQDMAGEKAGNLLLEDSGKHPTPAARPFVYIEVLRRLGMDNAATALEKRWKKILLERLVKDTGSPNTQAGAEGQTARSETDISSDDQWQSVEIAVGGKGIRLDAVCERLRDAANFLCDHFLGDGKTDQIRSHLWTPDIGKVEEDEIDSTDWLEKIYAPFEKKVAAIQPNFVASPFQITAKYDWDNLVRDRGFLDQDNLNALAGDTTNGNGRKIPVNNWLKVLVFDGWNTEGPGGGVPHVN